MEDFHEFAEQVHQVFETLNQVRDKALLQARQLTRLSAQTIRAIRHRSPGTTIEVLIPDFLKSDAGSLETVVEARPDVLNHNLETVPGLYPEVRPGARYFHSLRLLQRVKELDPAMFTKSGIMVGLGEDRQGVTQVARDPLLLGGAFFGMGTGVSGVTRAYSQLLETQVMSADSRRAEYATDNQYISQVDNGRADADTGLTPALNQFFGAMQSVSSNPTNVAARQALREAARRVKHA